MSRAISNAWRRQLAGGIGLTLLLSGCATFRMPAPENFARIEKPGDRFRALTPQEDKLLVRHFVVDEVQTLNFWTDALRNNFVDERGYTLKEEGEFKTNAGLGGQRFLFEISMSDVPYQYVAVVFVTEGRRIFRKCQHIYVAEFLCEKKNFDANLPAVEKALKQFEPLLGKPLPPPAKR